ncbi:MAG: sulfite exporter TauE/SafE family protein [bacterium]
MDIYILLLLVAIGLFTGGASGILGIGGAIILIPALIYLCGFTQQQAVGTSLSIMLPPIGFFAAMNYYRAGHVNVKYAIVLAVMFMVGSYITSKIAVGLPESVVRKVFSVFLAIVAIKMFFTK